MHRNGWTAHASFEPAGFGLGAGADGDSRFDNDSGEEGGSLSDGEPELADRTAHLDAAEREALRQAGHMDASAKGAEQRRWRGTEQFEAVPGGGVLMQEPSQPSAEEWVRTELERRVSRKLSLLEEERKPELEASQALPASLQSPGQQRHTRAPASDTCVTMDTARPIGSPPSAASSGVLGLGDAGCFQPSSADGSQPSSPPLGSLTSVPPATQDCAGARTGGGQQPDADAGGTAPGGANETVLRLLKQAEGARHAAHQRTPGT